jgi:hypothetical protein
MVNGMAAATPPTIHPSDMSCRTPTRAGAEVETMRQHPSLTAERRERRHRQRAFAQEQTDADVIGIEADRIRRAHQVRSNLAVGLLELGSRFVLGVVCIAMVTAWALVSLVGGALIAWAAGLLGVSVPEIAGLGPTTSAIIAGAGITGLGGGALTTRAGARRRVARSP